jgi:hypothetical protein
LGSQTSKDRVSHDDDYTEDAVLLGSAPVASGKIPEQFPSLILG